MYWGRRDKFRVRALRKGEPDREPGRLEGPCWSRHCADARAVPAGGQVHRRGDLSPSARESAAGGGCARCPPSDRPVRT